MKTLEVGYRVLVRGGLEATVRGFGKHGVVGVSYYTPRGAYRRSWILAEHIEQVL